VQVLRQIPVQYHSLKMEYYGDDFIRLVISHGRTCNMFNTDLNRRSTIYESLDDTSLILSNVVNSLLGVIKAHLVRQ
jgi:hypothetical protein